MCDAFEIMAEAAPYPIHRMQRGDAGRIAAFITTLDRETLQLRFDRFMSAAAIEAHYAGLDWDRAVLLAWGIAPDIRGVVEVHVYPTLDAADPEAIEAEIALVVAQGWRGRGIGQLLLESGVAAAAWRGAVRSTMVLAAQDHALSRSARRLGFAVDAGADRAVLAHLGEIGGR